MTTRLNQMRCGLEQWPNPDGCEKESDCFSQTALLWSLSSLSQTHEPGLLELLENFPPSNGDGPHTAQIKDHLGKEWKPNMTLIDVEWQRNRKDGTSVDVGFNPFDLADRLYVENGLELPTNTTQLYEHAAPFFIEAAQAIKQLNNRITVELICGEFAAVLNRYAMVF